MPSLALRLISSSDFRFWLSSFFASPPKKKYKRVPKKFRISTIKSQTIRSYGSSVFSFATTTTDQIHKMSATINEQNAHAVIWLKFCPINVIFRGFIFLPNALDQTFRAVAHKAAPPRLCHCTKLSVTTGSAPWFSFLPYDLKPSSLSLTFQNDLGMRYDKAFRIFLCLCYIYS